MSNSFTVFKFAGRTEPSTSFFVRSPSPSAEKAPHRARTSAACEQAASQAASQASTTMLGLLLVGSVAFSSRATSLRVRAPQPRAALVTAIIAAAADEEIESRLWLVKVRAALGLGLDSFDHGRVRGEALG